MPITIGSFLAKKLKFTSLNCVAKKEQKKLRMRINSSIDKRVEEAVFKQNHNKEFFLVLLFQFTSRIYYKLEKKSVSKRKIAWDYDDEYFDYIYILMYVSM